MYNYWLRKAIEVSRGRRRKVPDDVTVGSAYCSFNDTMHFRMKTTDLSCSVQYNKVLPVGGHHVLANLEGPLNPAIAVARNKDEE